MPSDHHMSDDGSAAAHTAAGGAHAERSRFTQISAWTGGLIGLAALAGGDGKHCFALGAHNTCALHSASSLSNRGLRINLVACNRCTPDRLKPLGGIGEGSAGGGCRPQTALASSSSCGEPRTQTVGSLQRCRSRSASAVYALLLTIHPVISGEGLGLHFTGIADAGWRSGAYHAACV